MQSIIRPARPRRGLVSRVLAMSLALVLSVVAAGVAQPAAAAAYVGAELGDVKPEDRAVVANPQPVQVIFEFRTKGAPNAQATQLIKAKVIEAVQSSGVFSEVSEQPVANGAVLSVVIDNVVDEAAMREATGKGFVTGATFFIAGSNVRDNYVATLDYVSGPGAPTITRKAGHWIVTQLGLINSAPQGAVKIGKTMDAVFVMARQIVANPLNEIAKDPAFGAPPAAPATPVEAPAEPTPADAAPTEEAPAETAEPATAPAQE